MAKRHLRQPERARRRAGLLLIAALIGLGGCLNDGPAPVPFVPPRLSPEALADSTNAVVTVVRSPHAPDWYDRVWPAIAPFRQSEQEGDAVPSLLALLGDSNPAIRRHAAYVLAKLAERRWREQPGDLASALTVALADDDVQVREVAARSAAHVFTDRAVGEILLATSRDPAPRVRWAAIAALAYWGRTEAADARLLEAFNDPDTRTRYAAAYGLRQVLPASPARSAAMADALIARMAGDNAADGQVAAHQMGLSGLRAGERHLPTLTALARSSDPIIRRRAASEIQGQLLRQQRKGGLDRELLATQIALHRADLANYLASVRAAAAWSLRAYRELDSSSLPQIESALARETDIDTRHVLHYVQAELSGKSRDSFPNPGWFYDKDLCLPHEAFAIMGLRPWDDEIKVQEVVGEPVRVTAHAGEDDGGLHMVYGYEYANFAIEIARIDVLSIATRSRAVVVAGGLRVGITRREALALLGATPSPEALAAREFTVSDCDTMGETYLRLEFGIDGRIAAIRLKAEVP